MNSKDYRNIREAYLDVYDNIMEKEDSEYEKASDAALDARYGYGRATGDKHSFGRAANRASAAASLRALRRGERSGSGTSREAGSDAVHQGWAKTAKTSTDQTPAKKERRAVLANTPYSNLPDDEKEKDRVSFDAVRATYNRNKNINASYEPDLFDVILEYLITEGYADTQEAALAIMGNMSEDWREDIMEKENSEYEKASDAALDARYGYGRATGDKHSFGRAANRASAAASLRALRRGERSGSGTSREAGSDAVHQGWAKTAKTSTDQTPAKKERRAVLANTPYSNLPDDEKEKDRVSFDAVRATYNRNKR